MNISKFSAGSGSVIKLKISMNAAKQNLSYYNYTVSAAFDQGSVMGRVLKPSDALTLGNLPSKVWQYVVDDPIVVASEIAIIPVGWITIKWWLGKRFRDYLISRMINSILYIRRDLLAHNYSVRYADTFITRIEDISRARRLLQNRFDITHLTLIDDLIDALRGRFGYIASFVPFPSVRNLKDATPDTFDLIPFSEIRVQPPNDKIKKLMKNVSAG
jgi:hypothetical protein